MIITSQYPCPHVPDVSVPEYVLRHAPRLHDRPALVDFKNAAPNSRAAHTSAERRAAE